jgi:hypothetical protein
MVSLLVKYYVVIGLSAFVSALTYLLNQPSISEASVVSAILVAITFALHDLEQNDNKPQDAEQTKGGGGGNPSIKLE